VRLTLLWSPRSTRCLGLVSRATPLICLERVWFFFQDPKAVMYKPKVGSTPDAAAGPKQVNVVVRADTHGSVDAILDIVHRIPAAEVRRALPAVCCAVDDALWWWWWWWWWCGGGVVALPRSWR
jgi:hypothetical protein